MNPLKALQDHGLAVWLDFLARGFTAKGGLKKLVDHHPLRIVHREQRFLLLGVHARKKILPLATAQRIGKRNLVVGRHRHHFLVALVGRKVDESLDL